MEKDHENIPAARTAAGGADRHLRLQPAADARRRGLLHDRVSRRRMERHVRQPRHGEERQHLFSPSGRGRYGPRRGVDGTDVRQLRAAGGPATGRSAATPRDQGSSRRFDPVRAGGWRVDLRRAGGVCRSGHRRDAKDHVLGANRRRAHSRSVRVLARGIESGLAGHLVRDEVRPAAAADRSNRRRAAARRSGGHRRRGTRPRRDARPGTRTVPGPRVRVLPRPGGPVQAGARPLRDAPPPELRLGLPDDPQSRLDGGQRSGGEGRCTKSTICRCRIAR